MSAHFWGYITCYEPTSHIEVEHTVGSTAGKNRTPFSGPEAVSFFCSFRDWTCSGFLENKFVCLHIFNGFWKHCFFPFCFFENEFVFFGFRSSFFPNTNPHFHTTCILCHVKFWSSGSKIALIPPLAMNYSKKLMGPLESLARLWIIWCLEYISTQCSTCDINKMGRPLYIHPAPERLKPKRAHKPLARRGACR